MPVNLASSRARVRANAHRTFSLEDGDVIRRHRNSRARNIDLDEAAVLRLIDKELGAVRAEANFDARR